MENPHKEELAEIRKWLEHGDLGRACAKFKIDYSQGSKMLHGKTAYLKIDFIAELAKLALRNKSKIMNTLQSMRRLGDMDDV